MKENAEKYFSDYPKLEENILIFNQSKYDQDNIFIFIIIVFKEKYN
jgi:hypothetical protein